MCARQSRACPLLGTCRCWAEITVRLATFSLQRCGWIGRIGKRRSRSNVTECNSSNLLQGVSQPMKHRYFLYWPNQSWDDWNDVSVGAVTSVFGDEVYQEPNAPELFYGGSLEACESDLAAEVHEALTAVLNHPTDGPVPGEEGSELFWHNPHLLLPKIDRLARAVGGRARQLSGGAEWYLERSDAQSIASVRERSEALDDAWREFNDDVSGLQKTLRAAIDRGAESVVFLMDPSNDKLELAMGPRPTKDNGQIWRRLFRRFFRFGHAR